MTLVWVLRHCGIDGNGRVGRCHSSKRCETLKTLIQDHTVVYASTDSKNQIEEIDEWRNPIALRDNRRLYNHSKKCLPSYKAY